MVSLPMSDRAVLRLRTLSTPRHTRQQYGGKFVNEEEGSAVMESIPRILAVNCLTYAARIAKGSHAVLDGIERILVRRFTGTVDHWLRTAEYAVKGLI